MTKIMAWYHKHEIIVQEFIRAGAMLPIWWYGLWLLRKTGLIIADSVPLILIGVGIAVTQFTVLVVLRKKTGQKLRVTRIRYMLILILVVCVAVFIWFMSEGEVARAVLSAIVVLFLGVLTLFLMRKRGI